jgi:hypothetical protein
VYFPGAAQSGVEKMEKWLGVVVVLFVLALNLLARRRSCGSCKSCGNACGKAGFVPQQVGGAKSETDPAAVVESKT